MRRLLQGLFLLAGLILVFEVVAFWIRSCEKRPALSAPPVGEPRRISGGAVADHPNFPSPEKRVITVTPPGKSPPVPVQPVAPPPAPVKARVAASTGSTQQETPPKTPPATVPPDFKPELLQDLPHPVKAPSEVSLPELVIESGQWNGSQCGITQPMQMVFRNPESWRSFWKKAIAPYDDAFEEVPPVDFSHEMIVGVFQGSKPLPGYQIRIESAKTEQTPDGPALIVRYRNVDRFLGIFATRFAVQPFHLMKVNTFPGKVAFIEIKNPGKKESHD